MIEKYLREKSPYIGIDINKEEITCIEHIKYNSNIDLYLVKTHNIVKKFNIQECVGYIDKFLNHFKNVLPHNFRLKIILMPTKYKKVFPTSNILSSKHVNNGLTWPFYNEIFIYRYEDMFKTLIHELIHFFKLDLQTKSLMHHSDLYHQNLFIDKTNEFMLYDINEAYTETLAIIVYINFTYDNNQLKEAFAKHDERFRGIACALINHAKNKTIVQYSHGYSYYIARAILFHRRKEFMNIIVNTNITPEQKKHEICILLKHSYKIDKMIKSSREIKSMKSTLDGKIK